MDEISLSNTPGGPTPTWFSVPAQSIRPSLPTPTIISSMHLPSCSTGSLPTYPISGPRGHVLSGKHPSPSSLMQSLFRLALRYSVTASRDCICSLTVSPIACGIAPRKVTIPLNGRNLECPALGIYVVYALMGKRKLTEAVFDLPRYSNSSSRLDVEAKGLSQVLMVSSCSPTPPQQCAAATGTRLDTHIDVIKRLV